MSIFIYIYISEGGPLSPIRNSFRCVFVRKDVKTQMHVKIHISIEDGHVWTKMCCCFLRGKGKLSANLFRHKWGLRTPIHAQIQSNAYIYIVY